LVGSVALSGAFVIFFRRNTPYLKPMTKSLIDIAILTSIMMQF